MTARHPLALFTPRFFLMCGFTFTVFLSAFMLFPTAPFHILDLGGTSFHAGLFLGLLTYGSALTAPFTGALADRLGKKRTLVVSGATLSVLTLCYAFMPTTTSLLALVPVHGLFWSGMLTASPAYLLDFVPASRRAEGLAYWGLSTVSAIAVAPAMAFWLYETNGWSAVCGMASALNVVMTVIASRLEESPSTAAPGERTGGFIEWRVLAVSLTLFLMSFGYGGITSFVALYAEASDAPKGLYFTALALVILVTRPVIGRVGDRVGPRNLFVPCLAIAAVGVALLLPGGTRFWLVSSAIVFGVGFGAAFPLYTAHVTAHVPASRRGAAFGSMLAAFDTGIGTGSMVLGAVIESAGYTTAFAFAAGIASLALPYFLVVDPRLLASTADRSNASETIRSTSSS